MDKIDNKKGNMLITYLFPENNNVIDNINHEHTMKHELARLALSWKEKGLISRFMVAPDDCISNGVKHNVDNGWTFITDDVESYPECFEYVLVEDDCGDKNVACCHPDYEWFISNGEDSLKLIGNIVKWRKLSL